MRYPVVVAALAALAACETPSSPPELHPTLLTGHAWSRGEILVSDPAFRATPTLPSFSVGAHALVARRVDDTTMAVMLPDTGGPVVLRVSLDGSPVPVGPVTVYGFRDAHDGPYLSGYLLPWPPENPLGVLGAGDSGAVIVDLRFNVVSRAFPESVHSPDCAWGVGPSVFPGHVVFYARSASGACGQPVSWAIGASLTPGDSLYGFAGTWSLAQLGRRRSLASSDSHLHLNNCDGTCQFNLIFGGGGVTGVTLSPRGDRAALDKGGGLPSFVLETQSLTSAYNVPGMHTTNGAAFSAGGDTLFIVGSDTSASARHLLAVIDATAGTLLASVPVDSIVEPARGYPAALALDPLGEWIYVALSVGSFIDPRERALLVFDRRSLALRGVLRHPDTEVPQFAGFNRIVPLPSAETIYLVATQQGYNLRRQRPRILRFDRLPDSP